jgi:hypothetical protein
MSLNLNKIVKRDLMDSNPMAIKTLAMHRCRKNKKGRAATLKLRAKLSRVTSS